MRDLILADRPAQPNRKFMSDVAALVDFLRTSPARSILDRHCTAAADAAGLMTAAIVMRLDGQTEIIATHGVWLMEYRQTARTIYSPRLDKNFCFESENIQLDTRFSASDFVIKNPRWRYGAMVMIEHEYAQEVDLELWCADGKELPADGSRLAIMKKSAAFVSDVISLIIQLWTEQNESADRDERQIKDILTLGINYSSFCAGLVDENLNIVAASSALISFQEKLGGPAFALNQPLSDFWFDSKASADAIKSVQSGQPLIGQKTTPVGTDLPIDFDLMTTSFRDGQARFGLVTVRQILFSAKDTRTDLIVKSADESDGSGPVSQFLLSTLLKNTRLSKRKDQAYLSTRSWRKSVKDHQISALKALKSDPPIKFVEMVADELVSAIQSVHGAGIARHVVPVPCGHSTGDCFSVSIARSVASKLGLEFVDVFERQSLTGSSHPKQNKRRPAMKVVRQIEGAAILVDDVATSGAHIEEASRLLRKTVDTVWPIVWIAD